MLLEFTLGYFDPGSGSILLQVLVGGFAGAMVFGKYLWHQIHYKISPSSAVTRVDIEIPKGL